MIEIDQNNNASNFAGHFQHAQELQAAQQWSEAAAAYAAALKLDQTHAICHYRLGFCLEKLQDWRGAVQAYQSALAHNRKKIKWLYRLGLVQQRHKDWQGAFKTWKRYLARERSLRSISESTTINSYTCCARSLFVADRQTIIDRRLGVCCAFKFLSD